MLQVGNEIGFSKIKQENPWLASTPLVVKPDQLIKRRGKAGLLAVNKTWQEVKAWITERMGKNQQVCTMSHELCLDKRHGISRDVGRIPVIVLTSFTSNGTVCSSRPSLSLPRASL